MKKHDAVPSDEPPTGICDSCGRVVYVRDGVALDHPVGAYPKAPNCPGSSPAVPSVKVGAGAEGRSLPTVDVGIPMPPVKAAKGDGTEADPLVEEMDEVCIHCGFAKWYHSADRIGWCPEHPGRMDWTRESTFTPRRADLTAAIAAAREEGREEAATVPCEACEGDGYAPRKEDREGYLDGPCTAPGCVNGRVDARLDAVMWAVAMIEDYGGKTVARIIRAHALAKYGPEAKETT